MPKFRPLSETRFINDANLVAYYPLENTTDVKGGFNLTNNNSVAFNHAKFGNGADFGTTNTNKSLSINNNLGITTGNVTISLLVKMNTEISAGGQIFLDLRNSVNDVSYKIAYQYNAGSRRLVFSRTRESIQDNDIFYSLTMGITDYYNLVLTYDGTTLKGFVNSVPVGSLATSGSGTGANDNFVLGFYDGSSLFYSSAIIDDTAIFSRALSASEVNELYQGMTYGEYLGAGSATTKLLLHLNGNSTDSSGNGNNGTATNLSYVNGKYGLCGDFSSSKIEFQDAPFDFGTGDFTFIGWLNPDTYPTAGNAEYVFSKGNGGGVSQYWARIENTSGQLRFLTAEGSNLTLVEADATTTIAKSTWSRVAFTRIGTTLSIYINGKLAKSTTGTIRNCDNSYNLFIGCSGLGSTTYENWDGKMDEFICENRGWTAQMIAKDYDYAMGRYATL